MSTEYIIVNSCKYKVINKLGEGGFGKVYKVIKEDENNNKYFAIKEIELRNESQESIISAKKESEVLSKFNSEYIIKYYDSSINDKKFYILMEYFDGQDLRDFLINYKNNNQKIDEKIIIKIIEQICYGIKEIHDKNIIHRDLKPENILIDKNNKIKIGDFGLSKQFNSYKSYTFTARGAGTTQYTAPEILGEEKKYNKKSDLWALGCIIYELFTQNLYFYDKMTDKIQKIKNEKYQKLIDSLLTIDYKKRLDIEQIIDKFIIEKMNKYIISNRKVFGIINGNCLFNVSLQIILSCEEFIKELSHINCKGNQFINYLHQAIQYLIKGNSVLDASKFYNYFRNHIFKNYLKDDIEFDSNCLIENIINITNDELIQMGYKNYPNKINSFKGKLNEGQKKYDGCFKDIKPQTKIYSIFSLIYEENINGKCPFCSKLINRSYFNSNIMQSITMDLNNKCSKYYVRDLIEKYMKNYVYRNCLCCNRNIKCMKEIKIIKLPEILFFSIESKKSNIERSHILLSNEINLANYAPNEKNPIYRLFALNIKLGNNSYDSHYIYHVEREGIWYEINDQFVKKIQIPGENYSQNIKNLHVLLLNNNFLALKS